MKGFRRFGTMVDCSRNAVMRPETVCRWAELTHKLGFNTLMLYTEDTYEVENRPYFGYGRGRYSEQELRKIDDFCHALGMELIPCVQTLAHLGTLTRWEAFRPMVDVGDILLIDEKQTYALIEDMFKTLARCFRSRVVNVGMDEAHLVGRGKYYDLHGDADRSALLLRHVRRVAEIGKRYSFTLLMWSDMFFRLAAGGAYYAQEADIDAAVSQQIPENVQLIYWDYYSEEKAHYDAMLAAHHRLKDGTWFAGGLWSWAGFCPHNRYSIDTTRAAFAACREQGTADVFLTLWGDNGGECSRFSLLPSLWFAAKAAEGTDDCEAIKKGFEEQFGVSFDDFMLLDLPGSGNDVGRCNAEKYLLYNDPLMGLLDSALTGTEAKVYGSLAERLEAVDAKDFKLQFETLAALCRVLEKKADLGQRIRKAYARQDKAALNACAEDCEALLPRLRQFYTALRAQWMAENKPQGFEVQDARLGGLERRIFSCAQTLRAYLGGELDAIEELEQPQLDYRGGGSEFGARPIYCNRWERIITAGNI